VLALETLEDRRLFIAEAIDLIDLDVLRQSPLTAEFDGAGVTIAVIDSGLRANHPSFGPDTNTDGKADIFWWTWDFEYAEQNDLRLPSIGDPDADDNGRPDTLEQLLSLGGTPVAPAQISEIWCNDDNKAFLDHGTFVSSIIATVAPSVRILFFDVSSESPGSVNDEKAAASLKFLFDFKEVFNLAAVNLSF
jgi:subtilisin family serine protease